MSDEEIMDARVKELAQRTYNPPPEAPREAMWSRIREAGEFKRRARQQRFLSGWRARAAVGVAAAAVLVLGIAIGRITLPGDGAPAVALNGAPPEATSDEPAAGRAAYRFAAVQHLARTEALLAAVGSRSELDEPEELAAWATELLTSTRLLLDSPAAADARLRPLLEDLELVLAQIARANGPDREQELRIVDDALQHNNMMLRLRTAVPAGPARAGA